MKILIYDSSERAGWVRHTWRIWARVWHRHFDLVLPVSSWDMLDRRLVDYSASIDVVKEVQYWGHGRPGAPICGGAGVPDSTLEALAEHTYKDAKVWWRCCSVFGGAAGHAFAKRCSHILDCTVFGHTYKIGFWQSGFRGTNRGREVDWSTIDGDGGNAWSHIWLPRTVWCGRLEVPRWM